MREKGERAAYTPEYKLGAVRLVQGGQPCLVTAKVLGMPEQTLENWVRQAAEGELAGAGARPVGAGADGTGAIGSGAGAGQDGARHLKKSGGVLCAGTRVKCVWIERHQKRWPITLQCGVLGVSAGGYFGHQRRKASAPPAQPGKRISDEALPVHIEAAHRASKGEYGWPRIWKELRANGVRAGKERIRRLVEQRGIKARGKTVWAGDTTHTQTDGGWLYLAVVLDLYSRQVVGWGMRPHMQTSLVADALRMAWFRGRPGPGLVFRPGRGSRYCGHAFRQALAGHGMQSPMGGEGNCWGNAPTESLWGPSEVGRLYGMRFETRRQAMDEVIGWLAYCNRRRLHPAPGYTSPMRFEKNWFAAQLKDAA